MGVMPAFSIPFFRFSGTGSVKVLLKAINSCRSMPGSPEMLCSNILWFQSTSSAAPTRTFLGSQPRRAQVPLNGRESIWVPFQPDFAHFPAAAEPPDPAPMTIRSNLLSVIVESIRGFTFVVSSISNNFGLAEWEDKAYRRRSRTRSSLLAWASRLPRTPDTPRKTGTSR